MSTLTMADAIAAYRSANDRGLGYAPYTDIAGDDTLDNAIACAQADGFEVRLPRETSDDVVVLMNGDGETMLFGADAMGRNVWAVAL